MLIGSRARMPILLVFCGIIGGANVYGVTGLMIGPIVIASLLAFVTIYREHYSPESDGRAAAAEGSRSQETGRNNVLEVAVGVPAAGGQRAGHSCRRCHSTGRYAW